MDKILENINKLYEFHIVPGWRWNDQIWDRFRALFNVDKMFRDSSGNVYLNCSSESELEKLIKNNRTLILQAHLDHPGAYLVGKSINYNSKPLYSAIWGGGYLANLEGKPVGVYDIENKLSEICKIEKQVKRFGERVIYFTSDITWGQNTFIHYPDECAKIVSDHICGWSLDDCLNAAILMSVFSDEIPENVIGLLTLHEEIGCLGIEHFRRLIESMDGKSNITLINFEASDENEASFFLSGSGVRVRSADSGATFSSEVVSTLSSILPSLKVEEIKTGGTEAGRLHNYGFTCGALTMPIRNAHNGSRDKTWFCEEARTSDVIQMYEAVKSIAKCDMFSKYSKPAFDCKSAINPRTHIVDEIGGLVPALKSDYIYTEFIQNFITPLNIKQAKYGLNPISVSADNFLDFKSHAVKMINAFFENIELITVLATAYEKLHHLTGIAKGADLPIYILLSDTFNAKQIMGGIALSALNFNPLDTKRILAHELTHWMLNDEIKIRHRRYLLTGVLSEGLACYLSSVFANVDAVRAINVKPEKYDEFCSVRKILKSKMLALMKCSDLEVKGNRHKYIVNNDSHDPFHISADNPYNKYGYFLGYEFILYCVDRQISIREIVFNPSLIESCFSEYLND